MYNYTDADTGPLIEFIEMQLLLGVDRIFLYDFQNIRKIFNSNKIAVYVSDEYHFCTKKLVISSSPNTLMQKLTTETRISHTGHRTKSIIKPQYVYHMHIHVPVPPSVYSRGIIKLPQFICTVNHYRNHHKCYNVPTVRDTSALKFQDKLMNQIMNAEKSISL